jgi:hypothetical protein
MGSLSASGSCPAAATSTLSLAMAASLVLCSGIVLLAA